MTRRQKWELAWLESRYYETSDNISRSRAAFYRKFHKLGWVSRMKWDRPRVVRWKITDEGKAAIRAG